MEYDVLGSPWPGSEDWYSMVQSSALQFYRVRPWRKHPTVKTNHFGFHVEISLNLLYPVYTKVIFPIVTICQNPQICIGGWRGISKHQICGSETRLRLPQFIPSSIMSMGATRWQESFLRVRGCKMGIWYETTTFGDLWISLGCVGLYKLYRDIFKK